MNQRLQTRVANLHHLHVLHRTHRASTRHVLLAGLFILSSRVFADSLVTNGDFESGSYSQTFGTSTDNLPNGWSNSPPTNLSKVNVFANGSGPGSAQSGTHYLAFQSAVTDGTQDCLFAVLNTVPNQKYTVSFWVAMTASSGAQFGLGPEWDAGGANNTTLGTTAFYYHPINSPAVPYTFFSFTVTASSSSTVFYLHGADATGAVLVDNVSVTPVAAPVPKQVPLPAWAILAIAVMLTSIEWVRQRRG